MMRNFIAAAAVVLATLLVMPATFARQGAESPTPSIEAIALQRFEDDLAAMQTYRPSYPFWQHLFMVPDGHIVFGSESTGRLLLTVPTRGDWIHDAEWADPALAVVMDGPKLPRDLDGRREEMARRLESLAGPVVHNPTRGLSLLPNGRRYGGFLREWASIYERFGVPPAIGLAQAIVESGLSGTVRSRARALGFCQWLQRNWNLLNRLSPNVIEAYNQTTQASYCAAYLTILATKYGSYIPALSEHHAGGTNVGRALINGEWLGGKDIQEIYFLGADFIRDLRSTAPRRFKDLYGTYGPRSALYAEMVFGNMANVERLMAERPQEEIYAMRTPRAFSLAEIARVTRLPSDEIRRFNPALRRQVPARATLYLPRYVKTFGRDVSFWHRPMTEAYAAVLRDFLALDVPLAEWDSRAFDPVLIEFQRRFEATDTEEGSIMATTLEFVLRGQRTSRQGAILAEFRSSERIQRLFAQGRTQRDAELAVQLDDSPAAQSE